MLTSLSTNEIIGNILLKLNVTSLEHSDFMSDYMFRAVMQANDFKELEPYLPKSMISDLMWHSMGCLYVPHKTEEIDYLKANKVRFNELVSLYKALELL